MKVKGKRADAGCRGRSYAGQGHKLALGHGHLTAGLADGLRGAVHRQGAAVVAQALPLVQDVGGLGRGQHGRGGKALQPALPAAVHAADLRLLQHDLRDPDSVRVTRAPPGQVPVELAAALPDGGAEGEKFLGRGRSGSGVRHGSPSRRGCRLGGAAQSHQ